MPTANDADTRKRHQEEGDTIVLRVLRQGPMPRHSFTDEQIARLTAAGSVRVATDPRERSVRVYITPAGIARVKSLEASK